MKGLNEEIYDFVSNKMSLALTAENTIQETFREM